MKRRVRVAENKPGEEQVEDCTHHMIHDIQAVNTGIVNSYSLLLYKKYVSNGTHKAYFHQAGMLAAPNAVSLSIQQTE